MKENRYFYKTDFVSIQRNEEEIQSGPSEDMTQNKEHLCKEILTEVKDQMLRLTQCNDKGRPNYSWLSQGPRLTSQQKEKLEMLTSKLGEAECRTAVMALRAELSSESAASPSDIPQLMCRILKQLVQDCKTADLFSAAVEKRHSAMQNEGFIAETKQEALETIAGHVEATASQNVTRWSPKVCLPQEEPRLHTLTVCNLSDVRNES